MTFSQKVKTEILRSVRNAGDCCARSFLIAVLKSAGSLTIGSGGYAFSVESDNVDFLTLIGNLAQERLQVKWKISTYNMSAKGTAVYSCKFDASLGEKLGITVRDGDGALVFADVKSLIPTRACCLRAFFQGLFVAAGSVVIPPNGEELADRVKYHLELRFTDNEFASAVAQAYTAAKFRFASRKSQTVLYLKGGELIADFLVYVNATSAKFVLEDVLIMRSIRNNANRQSNCTVANIDKAVAAAARQLQAISELRRKGLFDALPDNLKEIALAREANPEATLEEIADVLHISKSGASHRFAKLEELASK